MYYKFCGGQAMVDASQPPLRHGNGQPGPGAAEPPGLAWWQRCLAALIAEPRPCEGGLTEVRVVDRTGQGTTACRLHGAVLLASLDGARVFPLDGGSTAVHPSIQHYTCNCPAEPPRPRLRPQSITGRVRVAR